MSNKNFNIFEFTHNRLLSFVHYFNHQILTSILAKKKIKYPFYHIHSTIKINTGIRTILYASFHAYHMHSTFQKLVSQQLANESKFHIHPLSVFMRQRHLSSALDLTAVVLTRSSYLSNTSRRNFA